MIAEHRFAAAAMRVKRARAARSIPLQALRQ
jgi:hypothetical protein